ncbi:DUF1853 family protein [Aliikangiella sp. IMCC44653]
MSTQRYIQDLNWLLQSEPMMMLGDLAKAPPVDPQWLEQVNHQPEPLVRHLENKNLRMLGPYYEALWEFILAENPLTRLVTKNLQVKGKKQTLGEFDFIYQELKDGTYHHLEVAIKYYLGSHFAEDIKKLNTKSPNASPDESLSICEEASFQSSWIGPNGNDRLDLKLDKMCQKQVKLGLTPEGKAALLAQGVEHCQQHISLKGYLFYPWQKPSQKTLILPPVGVNPNHNKGQWLFYSQLHEWVNCESLQSDSAKWRVIKKPHWMAYLKAKANSLISLKQLQRLVLEHFEQSKRPLLVGKFEVLASESEFYTMTDSIFIVDDAWPQIQ